MSNAAMKNKTNRGDRNNRRFRAVNWWIVCLLCVFASFSASTKVYGAESARPKRVLIISTGSRLAPGFMIVDQQLLQALGSAPSVPTEIYAENLDLVRFPSERYRQIFRDYLADKYAAHHPDLVILVFVGTLGIPGKLLPELFPGTPIVVAGLTEEEVRTEQFGTRVTGVAQRVNPRAMLESIIRLQPELRHIVVIGGTAEIDRQVLQRVKEAAQSIKSPIQIDFWDNLTMAKLREAVVAMPQDTAILYARMFRDAAGQAVISSEVGRWIAQSANVPVYVMTDASFGTGAVGGSLASAEAFGQRAGELARLILTGTAPSSLPFEIRTDSVPTFDWRALKRWGISESRLPPGSMVRFKPPSLWQQYYWYIAGALIVIAIQTAMIVDLLLQRARRRRAEASLVESQQFMELATEAGGIGLWVRDLFRGDLWVNPRLRSLLGFGQADVLGVDEVMARIHPDDRAQVMSVIQRAEETAIPFDLEFRTAIPDTPERWLAVRGEFMRGPQGRLLRRMGTMIDITGRKLAEEALWESEHRYRTLAETAADVIITMDQNSTILFVNAAVEKILGYVPDDLIGRKITVLMPEPLRHRHMEGMRRYLETREKRLSWSTVSFPGLHKSGREISLEIAFAESRMGDRSVFTGIMRDITERKRVEGELQQQRDELAHTTRVSLMGELAASLAHELNQPLTAILSNAQAAQRFLSANRVDIEEMREILHDIVEDNNRAGEIIRQIRALVKKEELEFSSLDLASICREIVLLVHSDAVLRNVRVSLDIRPDLPYARGDKVQLQQVLLNLLLNAFDAMKDCPADERDVSVRAELDGRDMLQISVSDHGPGLTSDQLDKVFQPFFTTKCEGLGMGLSISRSIVEAHGGWLWAENNPNRGATFYFALPIAKENRERAASHKLVSLITAE
jgi:PAS domain S-box-containing protein